MTNNDNKELELLIRNCQKGRYDAQKAIYDLLAPKMFGVCLRYCKNHDEAEDCLQEGFVKVFTNIDRFQFKGSFEGWVRRIVVNTVMEAYRKKNPTVAVDDFTSFNLKADDDIDEEPVVSEGDILKMIDSLPPQYKMVFNLFAIEEYSHEEIAQMLGISVGTSKSNLSRARQWLKEHVNEMIKNKELTK